MSATPLTKRIGTTLLAWMPIVDDEALSRRDRETMAVHQILRHIGFDPETLAHDENGAPKMPGTHISISHSRRLAVVAVDPERPVGIDAEEWRAALHRVAPRYLSSTELATFTAQRALLRAWTIKEAVYKIAGGAAADFRAAIAIASDMHRATACGRTYMTETSDAGQTLITLVYPKQ